MQLDKLSVSRFVIVFFKKIACLSNKIANRLSPPSPSQLIQKKRVTQWFNDNGDKTYRLNYDLTPNSTVFDLGGYEGQWSSDIYAMYNSNILIFEPYIPFFENIKKRFSHNLKIHPFNFGLGSRTETVAFSMHDNASSMFLNDSKTGFIEIVSVIDFLKQKNIDSVDLIKINIEGAEYELLECLIDNDAIESFKNIQVQFHDFIIPDAAERMKEIQRKLSRTHNLTYQYEFVWENWKLKS